jgi:peptidoglycan/LPS O-acetylase OafA/YrhL
MSGAGRHSLKFGVRRAANGATDATMSPPPSGAEPSRTFRPDIQALRAIAVSSVVLYHFWPDLVRGGFVGVDIFFVISGFLITQHLVGELRRTGRIVLTQFWARRIRRLLPAAFAVLGVCVLMVLFLMPSVVWEENLQEIRASAAYVENWLLGFHAVDYLAAGNTPSIVQHYWSLSVEEQFYLVWPLLLLLAVGALRRLRRGSQLAAITAALMVVGVVSLVISIVETASQPAFSFFATPTRAWEFAAGALISTVPMPSALLQNAHVRAAASWLGLAVIVASCLLINGASVAFPPYLSGLRETSGSPQGATL